jgi:hypothetical protein
MILSLLAATLLVGVASAEAPARFRWQTGQVLTYKVEQATSALETVSGMTAETKTQLNLTRRWEVKAVDTAGLATLEMSLTALRLENTRPDGEKMRFDSADPSKGDAALARELSNYVGKPLALLRVDGLGRVIEVKESKHGPASRFQSELPFVLTLPGTALTAGQKWERSYDVTLDPPQGTGEKYPATQSYTCKAVTGPEATVTLTTAFKSLPEAGLDRIPLVQVQHAGEAVFDTRLGVLKSARLTIDQELKGHQGEGSSYRFQSSYSAQFVETKR